MKRRHWILLLCAALLCLLLAGCRENGSVGGASAPGQTTSRTPQPEAGSETGPITKPTETGPVTEPAEIETIPDSQLRKLTSDVPNADLYEIGEEQYYVYRSPYSGAEILHRLSFSEDGLYVNGERVSDSETGWSVPDEFPVLEVMDAEACAAYCRTWKLPEPETDSDHAYLVISDSSFRGRVSSVLVSDVRVEGHIATVYLRDEGQYLDQEESEAFVLILPADKTVTEVTIQRLYTENELSYLEAYGVPYDPEVTEAPLKPVIYLYPQEETQVTVRLDYDGRLTCTYPAYDGAWTVTARPDGTLTDAAGLTYNYLYWEGEGPSFNRFEEGFCVRGADTAAFLETALAELGLTRREANEFIVFWLPQMQNNPWNLISFQGAAYTDAARLEVSPAPDAVIRVFMAWKPLDAPVSLPAQALTAPARTGFTLVEWGGAKCS